MPRKTLEDALVSLSVGSSPSNSPSATNSTDDQLTVDDEPPNEIVVPSLAAMWNYTSEWNSLLNRTVFENALLSGKCPIYKSPPKALLHCLVSTGVRLAPDIVATPTQRTAWAKWHLEKAVGLLSSSYFCPRKQRTMSDIEAIQVTILAFFSAVAAGLGSRYIHVLERGAAIARTLCTEGPLPANEGSFPQPTNHIEWIFDEMRMRSWLYYFLLDGVYSYFERRQPFLDYTAFPFRIPCSEKYFNAADPAIAFNLLKLEQRADAFVQIVDLGQLLCSNLETRMALVNDLISSIFTRRRTLHIIGLFAGLLRLERIRIRDFAAAHAVDPFALAGKLAEFIDDSDDCDLKPAETQYLAMTRRMEEFVSLVRASLPPEIVMAFAAGDISLVFDRAETYFDDVRRAHAFIQMFTVLPGTLIENWVDEDLINMATFRSPEKGGPSDSQAMLRFLSSPIFRRLSENAIWLTRILEGQLAADPKLLYVHIATTLGKVRVGAFHLAAWKMHRAAFEMDPTANSDPIRVETMAGLERDVKIAAAWVYAIGTRFRPFGLQYARILAKHMLAAGMVSMPDGSAVETILTIDEELEAVELKREVKETDDDA